MRRFTLSQMTPEQREAQLQAKLAEKKAELAAKRAKQEEDLKRTMLSMKQEGKTVDEIKAFMVEEKKRWAAELAGGGAEKTYTIQELRRRPAALDQSKLESYLSDADFKSLFKMTKAEFEKTPKWKKDNLKKEQQIH